MGKGKRIKAEREAGERRDPKAKRNVQKQVKIGRRTWGKKAGLTIGGLVVSSLVFVGVERACFFLDEWRFLDLERKLPKLDFNYVINNYASLGPYSKLSSKSYREAYNLEEIRKSVELGLEKFGFKGKYFYLTFGRIHGVAESPKFTVPLKKYCETAVRFLYERLNGLKPISINWTSFDNGANYSERFDKRVYLGAGYYHVLDDVVFDRKDIRCTKKVCILPRNLAISMYNYAECLPEKNPNDESDEKSYYFACISTGKSALKAPFSEIIPFTTAEKDKEFKEEIGDVDSIEIREGFGEVLATILAKELVMELGFDKGVRIIKESNDGGVRESLIYSRFRKFERPMKRMGAQRSLDCYMSSNSAKSFLDSIEKYS